MDGNVLGLAHILSAGLRPSSYSAARVLSHHVGWEGLSSGLPAEMGLGLE